ncbi:MAG: trypsin-like peptidase domain-containing protein [Anaerolineae bacterium]
MRKSQTILLISITLLLFAATSPTIGQQNALDIERILRSTVYIMQARSTGNNLLISCVGSGTLVNRNGLILANAHNTVTNSQCIGNILIIAITKTLDEPPIAQYRAEIVKTDIGLDLALLQINQKLDGSQLVAADLALPFVELADSSTVTLDETVTIVGYSGTGAEAVTSFRTTISGLVFEPRSSNSGPSWLKINDNTSAIVSGGGTFDQNNQLVGVLTTAPAITEDTKLATCIPIQDTNTDGLINNNDQCVPQGTKANSVRPSNLARPLLRSAALGLIVNVQTAGTIEPAPSSPSVSRLFFAASVNETGMPTSVISSLPAGSTSLYLFFDYHDMTPETIYEVQVTTDGVSNPVFSFAPVRWSGGRSGTWYIGNTGQPWPNGIYSFTLHVNGIPASTIRLVIGEAPVISAIFSDIVFGLLDTKGNPEGNGYVLPVGNIASARFLYRNMPDGIEWSAIWYLNGTEFQRISETWNSGLNGSQTTSIEVADGLPPGSYRLELYIASRLAATSDFIIAGGQKGALPQVFSNIYAATAHSVEEAKLALPQSNFANTINNLYVLFDWQQIAFGTLWTIQWSVDGEVFFEQSALWNYSINGNHFVLQMSNSDHIPDGTYKIDLLINNLPLASTSVQVGIGQLPIDQFARANGIQIRGQILDRETHRGIAGVSIVIIGAEFSVEEFEWQQNQVFAIATTDSEGVFMVDRPLEFSTPTQTVAYSAIIAADGYLPLSADGIEVTVSTPNPLDIVLYLSRDL